MYYIINFVFVLIIIRCKSSTIGGNKDEQQQQSIKHCGDSQ